MLLAECRARQGSDGRRPAVVLNPCAQIAGSATSRERMMWGEQLFARRVRVFASFVSAGCGQRSCGSTEEAALRASAAVGAVICTSRLPLRTSSST